MKNITWALFFFEKIRGCPLYAGEIWRIFPVGNKKSVRLRQCAHYSVRFKQVPKGERYRNRQGPNVGVRLNQVSALEHVYFNLVSLYLFQHVQVCDQIGRSLSILYLIDCGQPCIALVL